jgi:amino acid adenylation domain-containing protein
VTTSGFELSIGQSQAVGATATSTLPTVQVAVPVSAPVAPELLAERLADSYARYDVLRTAFVRPVGLTTLLQSIGSTAAPEIGSHPGVALDVALGLERDAPFPLAGGQGVRVAVTDDHLLLTAAAAVADDRSLRLLAAELLSGDVAEADPLQFVDYASWEAEQLEDESADARIARSYWANALDDEAAAAAHELPMLELRSVPVRVDASLDADRWLALWAAVRARHAGPDSDGVVIAVAVSGRVDADLENAIGPYERYVPLVVANDPTASLKSLTARVIADAGAAHRFAVFAPEPVTATAFAAREKTSALPARGAFAVELVVTDGAATLWYAPERITPDHAERLAIQLKTLAAAAIADPDLPLAGIDVLGDAERAAIAATLTGSQAHEVTGSITEVIARHAGTHPDSPAVVHGADELTYAGLDGRSAAIAAALPQGPSLIGVLLDRSVDLVAAAIGVLRAGGAYVALEPASPPARIAEQLALADVSTVITDRTLAASLPDSVRPVFLDEIPASADPAASTAPAAHDDPAYVIFTSGSTGTPKPVVVTNGNVLVYGDSIRRRLGLDDQTRFAAVSGLSTDLGNTAVFGALLSGGALELVPTDVVGDGPTLARLLTAHGVTALKITPSHLRALLAGGDVPVPLPLLVLGGEALDPDLVAAARAAGVQRVVNHYGPTETTVGVFTYELPAAPTAPIPIGRPLDHVRAYVLDAQGLPTPLGAVGQLVLGGPSVAAGYANRPDETAERFVAEPGHDTPMYRTGDNVRIDDNGDVVFLGRSDGQVKIRGYRVELGEIEARLRQDDSIEQAAVVADDDVLTAYVVGTDVDSDRIRRRLADELPAFMIPQSVVTLDRLPLTPSGKLDRRRLAASAQPAAGSGSVAAPRTETEAALMKIWRDVLPTADLGVDDNFFQVGGHSLIATKVVARARAHFGVDIPLHVIFASSTVASMAADIDARRPEPHGDDDMAGLLDDLESISDEEAARLLGAESTRGADDA